MCFSRPWVSSTSNTWLERDDPAVGGEPNFRQQQAARNELDLYRERAHLSAGDETHQPRKGGVCFFLKGIWREYADAVPGGETSEWGICLYVRRIRGHLIQCRECHRLRHLTVWPDDTNVIFFKAHRVNFIHVPTLLGTIC